MRETARAFRGGIVLANGCFDILHPGHVAKLEEARELGYLLIVSVDHDDLVRQKGDGHPYMHFTDRMTVVAGLASVGLVTWHGGTMGSLSDLIRYLKPDIWASRLEVPTEEIEACHVAGTQIVKVPRQGDHSSSEIALTVANQ